ncbi:Conserved_hypothetical protein [Hexamita inflata]|uniref:EGF-like domain-containing protein n=1 Tax=Hexamita inflata TaxID=28002 RepID=A0ABP1LLB5_9EUKA
MHVFLYTNNTQNSNIDLQLYDNSNIFALFGFESNSQQIQSSTINISLTFTIQSGALICILCDAQILDSTLVFVATGQKVSGILQEIQSLLHLQNSHVQFRFNSSSSSGLINMINVTSLNISLLNSKISGYNLLQSAYNGYISSQVFTETNYSATDLNICVDINTQRQGSTLFVLALLGIEKQQCDVCSTQIVVYGLCADDIDNGRIVDGMMLCVSPFEYFEGQCKCAYGYILNKSICVQVVDSLTQLILMNNNNVEQLQQIDQQIQQIQSNLLELDQNIANNSTAINDSIIQVQNNLEQSIISNFSQSDKNLQQNTTLLDQRILNNITTVQSQIQEIVKDIDDKIHSNFTKADVNLLSNTSVLDKRIYENISNLTKFVVNTSAALESYIIKNFTQADFNLLSNTSALNKIIATNISQLNTSLLGNISVLNTNVSYLNNVSIQQQTQITALNSSIVKLNQSLIDNFNTLILMQQNMQLYFVQQINCISNLGYQMVNGSCVQVNCSVPGQISLNGICQCQPGYTTISGSCQNIIYQLNNSDDSPMCSQTLYITTFDFQMVTNNITSSLNFSLGYVFNTDIQNAFIDISDNVFTATAKPLFQTQTSFIHIKIQIGTQKLTGGQLMTSATQILVSQLIIVSKQGTQITAASGQLNIFQASATSANIQGLLLKLNFSMSAGNITVIGSIMNGTLNVQGYQVLGIYQSTSSIALISLTLSSTTVVINNLNFMPTIYNVGNQSSYLLNTVSESTIQITQVSTIIGNIDSFANITSISGYKIFVFGGLITNQSSTTTTISSYISDSYQSINVQYSQYSGYIVGQAFQNLNEIYIDNICLYQQINGTSQKLSYFGLIGDNEGMLTLTNSSISFSVQSVNLEYFGIIGYQNTLNIEIINVIATSKFLAQKGTVIGGIVGQSFSSNYTICNVNCLNNNIQNNGSGSYIGSIVGRLENLSSFKFVNSQINNSKLLIGGWSALLLGFLDKNSSALIQHISISNGDINGSRSNAIISGYTSSDSLLTVINATIINCNATVSDQSVSIFVGCAYSSTTIISDSKISTIRLYIPTAKLSYARFIIGENMGRSTTISSSVLSGDNYINDVLQTNCAIMTKNTLNGC